MPSSSPALCILVVDDNAAIRQALAQFLRLLGYPTREAATFKEAVAMLPEADAVVTDGMFPSDAGGPEGPFGLTLAEQAQALGLPVVLVSGDTALVDQARQAGHAAHAKPSRFADLLQALQVCASLERP
jgi:two-component system C4-dicarboxylate transport response regulator DctD